MEDVAPPRRRGAFLPSLVAALGLLAYLVTVATISTAVDRIGDHTSAPLDLELINAAQNLLLFAVFAGACLLSFWLIAPIIARLSFAHLILRVLVAAGVAFVVLVPIDFVLFSAMFAGTTVMPDAGGLYDLTYPALPVSDLIALTVKEAMGIAVGRLPEIALAALALWWWLRRKESSRGEA